MEMEQCQIIKVVLLGDSGVGKSSIALRFATDEFKPYSEATIGASFLAKTYTYVERSDDDDDENNESKDEQTSQSKQQKPQQQQQQQPDSKKPLRTIDYKIWDTAGQEKYHSLAPMYYRGSQAAILVYDICNPSTFSSLKKWVDELSVNGPENLILVVCGNKYDLKDHRKVDEAKAKDYARSVGGVYLESSARDDINVERIFYEIGKRVVPAEKTEVGGEGVGGGGGGSVVDLATSLVEQPRSWLTSFC